MPDLISAPLLTARVTDAVSDGEKWLNPENLSSTAVMIVLAVIGIWLVMKVVRAGFALLLLVVLWLVAAWLFGLPPIGGEGVLS